MRRILLILICLALLIIPVSADYALRFQALTNSPADSVHNYIGNLPQAPATVVNTSIQYIPVAGTINIAEIYDYSGTAGTAESYSYYLRINNSTTEYLINTTTLATNERVFTNSTMNVAVNAGDFVEIDRLHPAWVTNPLTNIVGGYLVVATTTKPGYTVFGQALTNSPADSVQNYLGGIPAAPTTTEGRNKVFLPEAGVINSSVVTDYSGTAGTNEAYLYSLNLNGTSVTPIQTNASTSNLRLFKNLTFSGISALRGNYIEWNRTHPAWVTNPLTNVVGSLAFINTTITTHAHGYTIPIEALTSTPTSAQTVYFGDRPIAPSTTAATNKIYIRQAGTITQANIYTYSGTAGTGEAWPIYVVKNNAQSYLIQTNSLSSNERTWWNTTIDIPVVAGDYLEIKGIQPTWGTPPATTIYGGYVYEMYDGAPPVPSFTTSNTSGTPPTIVTTTDTSVTTITSRSWTAVNTLNGTGLTFGAGASPATIVLDTGHWLINESVTNASETRISGNTLVTVNPSGGYTGAVLQDLWMQGQYTETFTINDADGNLINGASIISSTGAYNTTGVTGVGSITQPFGTATITISATGYYGKVITYVFDSDGSWTVQLVTASATPSSNTNLIYTPWQVRIDIMDYYSNPLPGTNVTAYYVASTLPSTNVSWLTSAFGIAPSVAADMTNSGLALAGTTDANGGLSFTMFKSIEYNLSIVNVTSGVSASKLLYPSDTEYKIRVPTTGQAPVNNTLAQMNGTGLPVYLINSSCYNLSMKYTDQSGLTTDVRFQVKYRQNGTWLLDRDEGAPGLGMLLDNFTVCKYGGFNTGDEVIWAFNATRSGT
jgi:hypothetical protein